MRYLSIHLVVAAAMFGLIAAACTPPPTTAPIAPAKPAATAAPQAAPAKAAEPTKSPAAQPTPQPAKKVDFPQKDKPVTILVGYAAGGSTDLGARVLAPLLEKQLGTPVQVINRVGAAEQVSLTEVSQSRPDGHTIGAITLPGGVVAYLDPDRKAVFSWRDLAPVALHNIDSTILVVSTNSPYKDVKSVLDAAKANPGIIKAGTGGLMTNAHFRTFELERAAGVKFSMVHFNGDAEGRTALLGGHIDIFMGTIAGWMATVKGGQVRVLGVMREDECKFLPGVKTMAEQGVKIYGGADRGIVAPAGTPKEIVDKLSEAIRKAMDTDEHKKRLEDMGVEQKYMSPAEFDKLVTQTENWVKGMLPEMKKQ